MTFLLGDKGSLATAAWAALATSHSLSIHAVALVEGVGRGEVLSGVLVWLISDLGTVKVLNFVVTHLTNTQRSMKKRLVIHLQGALKGYLRAARG